MDLSTLQIVAVSIIPILLAITVHEAAHGYAAKHFGDDTADKLGRISLNPLRHIDPFGTILLPLFTKLTAGFAFGWAKPVPYNPYNLRNQKWGPVWVALAGPAMNFIIASIATFIALLLPLGSLAKGDMISRFNAIISGRGAFVENFTNFSAGPPEVKGTRPTGSG